MLPLLFLSFLVGSLTSSSRTISKSFFLLRIDFVDDDEEEEEDKPSSSESSDAKKNEKQTKRTRRESKRSDENNTRQSFRCDSSACKCVLKTSLFFEIFALCLCLGCPNLIRSRSHRGSKVEDFPHKKNLTLTEKKKRFALLCSVVGPSVIFFD